MQSYQWFIYLFIHVYNVASIIINRTYTLLEYIFRSDLLFPLSSSHVSRTDRKSIVERYFSETEARLDRGIPEYITRHCTSRGIIMPSTEGSQFPGTGSELSKNCLTSAWMTSAWVSPSPSSLFLSLSLLLPHSQGHSIGRRLPFWTCLVMLWMRDDHPVSWEWRKGRKVEEREREGGSKVWGIQGEIRRLDPVSSFYERSVIGKERQSPRLFKEESLPRLWRR